MISTAVAVIAMVLLAAMIIGGADVALSQLNQGVRYAAAGHGGSWLPGGL